MTRTRGLLRTLGAVASALLVTVAVAGCGVSKSGIGAGSGGSPGSGGATSGHGGSVGAGGTTASGGSTTGATGSGGSGSGGTTKTGSGGAIGGSGGTLVGTGGATKTGFGGTGGTIVGTGGSVVVRTGGAGGGLGGTTKTGFGGTLGGAGGTTKPGFGGASGGAGGTLAGTGGMVFDGGAPDGPPPKCAEVTTQAECDARTDCHSVFEDPHNCACNALGCCARFKSCATGDYANCTGPAACKMAVPYCELPYVVAYTGSCYEGCVKQDDCGVLPCPQIAPQNGSACSTAYGTCYYEDCAGAGRTLAKCATGTWQVTSAECAPYLCEAPATQGGALTCAAGKLCVITTDTSFRTTPACVDQTCGTGPVSTSCIQGLTGSCSAKYKLDGVVVTCAMPVP